MESYVLDCRNASGRAGGPHVEGNDPTATNTEVGRSSLQADARMMRGGTLKHPRMCFVVSRK